MLATLRGNGEEGPESGGGQGLLRVDAAGLRAEGLAEGTLCQFVGEVEVHEEEPGPVQVWGRGRTTK